MKPYGDIFGVGKHFSALIHWPKRDYDLIFINGDCRLPVVCSYLENIVDLHQTASR